MKNRVCFVKNNYKGPRLMLCLKKFILNKIRNDDVCEEYILTNYGFWKLTKSHYYADRTNHENTLIQDFRTYVYLQCKSYIVEQA